MQVPLSPTGPNRAGNEPAVEGAEQAPMPRRCSKCGQRPGSEYAFYFGNKVGSMSTLSGNQRTTQVQYAMGGRGTAFVCESCITQKVRSRFLLAIGLLLLAGLALVGILAMEPIVGRAVWQEGISHTLLSLAQIAVYCVAAASFLRGIVAVVELIGTRRAEVGQQIALDSQKQALFDFNGYDSFWTERAYLKRH